MAGSIILSVLYLLTLDALQTSRSLQELSLQHSSDIRHSTQVMKALQQQQMLQAAGGIEGLAALLQNSPGASNTQQTTTIMLHHDTYQYGVLRLHVLRRAAKLYTLPNQTAAMHTGRVLTVQTLLEHVHG